MKTNLELIFAFALTFLLMAGLFWVQEVRLTVAIDEVRRAQTSNENAMRDAESRWNKCCSKKGTWK